MTPDREMDRKIATEVFKWRFEDFYNGGGFWHTLARCKRRSKDCDCPSVHNSALPHYSTNPADSKLLRDKLAETWPGSNLWRSPANENSERPFQYTLHPSMLTEPSVHGPYANTEELAVALAALKSVGLEVPCGK